MSHPSGWWGDMIRAMGSDYDDPVDAIHDLSLLTIRQDWDIIYQTDR